MNSSSFLVASLWSCMYSIMSSANSDSLNSSFPIWISLTSFSSLIAISWTSKTVFNSGESGHPYLVLDLRGNASAFHHWVWCYLYVCPIRPLLCWGTVPLMPTFWRVFIINGYWILSKAFSASIDMIILIFVLQFVDVAYHIDWFVDIEKSLHPQDEFHLIIVYNLFNVILDIDC